MDITSDSPEHLREVGQRLKLVTNLENNMVNYRLSLDIYGDEFDPLTVVRSKDVPFKIVDSSLDGDFDFGSLSIRHPELDVVLDDGTTEYQMWYVNMIEWLSTRSVEGMDRISLLVEIFCADQCNFEIFPPDMLGFFGDNGVVLTYSVYRDNG